MADTQTVIDTLWEKIRAAIQDKIQAALDAAGAAQTSADKAKSEADKAAQSASQAGEVVATGAPDATTSTKGKVQLAGDLAGTADAPTVPKLAAKLDKATTANAMYGTDGTGATWMYPIIGFSTPTANSVPIRTTGAQIRVGTPSLTDAATTKKYVDDLISGLQAAIDTRVNSRPALFSGAGAPPATIGGAVVGDWWLNTDTMELSKITGV